jgi:hypothetical protein
MIIVMIIATEVSPDSDSPATDLFLPCTFSVAGEILTPSQEMLLKPMCCRTASIALIFFTLNRKLGSPVSRRDALHA